MREDALCLLGSRNSCGSGYRVLKLEDLNKSEVAVNPVFKKAEAVGDAICLLLE